MFLSILGLESDSPFLSKEKGDTAMKAKVENEALLLLMAALASCDIKYFMLLSITFVISYIVFWEAPINYVAQFWPFFAPPSRAMSYVVFFSDFLFFRKPPKF